MGGVALEREAMGTRVILAGYYGFDNLGDELLLQAALDWLRRLEPVEPWVLSGNPAHTQRHFGARAVNRWNPLSVLRALRGARALVFGGGGVFQDATSARSLRYYLGLLHLARRLRVPTALLGQGLGPLSSRGQAQLARALRGVDYLSVRDRQSLQLAQSWGIPEVRLGPDLALSLSPRATAGPVNRPVWGLALVAPPPAQRERVLDELARAVESVREELDLTPVGLPCHPTDQAFARALRQRVPLTLLPPLQGTPAQCLALVQECQLLWASRLHALILSLLAGVPFVALGYDPKVKAFVDQVNQDLFSPLPYFPLGRVAAQALVAATRSLYPERAVLQPALLRRSAGLQRSARASLREAAHHLGQRWGLHPRGA